MVNNKLFKKPFDDGTIAKLTIFEKYLTEWLPVFISKNRPYWKNIYIYDFFAGAGKDKIGQLGSPLIILNILNKYSELIKISNVSIKVILNEIDKKLFEMLQDNVAESDFNLPVEIEYYNKSFLELFNDKFESMRIDSKIPRLIFLDQYGIKEITQEIFRKLISLDRTDFIFFISSSFVRRFSELDEFQKYLSVSKEDFSECSPFHSHRIVFNYYKSLVNTDYYLAPFSIKKGSNIYGLIFGSKHTLGIEKFLRICWGLNKFTGDANFNIDGESIVEGQYSLFGNEPNKLLVFKEELITNIMSEIITTTPEMYRFTLEYGCLPIHCNKVIKKLIKGKKIKSINIVKENIHKLSNEKINIL